MSPGPSVGLSDCPVDCGKMAEWIWTSFGMVGRFGPRMGQVEGVDDCPNRKGVASHCICYGNSVCLSVSVLCIKTAKLFVEILLPPNHSSFSSHNVVPTASRLTEAPNTRGVGEKNGRFLTNRSVYLGNDARYGHSCYRSRIGNHTRATKWWHFR